MMRALLIEGYGDRPATRVADHASGTLGDRDVRVCIEAAALNPLDAKIATGTMTDWFPVTFPYVPGTDFSGVVETVGAGVTDLAIGDPVFGRADPVRGGAIAERIVIDAGLVAHRPKTVSALEAACLPTPAGIAWQVLALMPRDGDEPVLILGNGAVAQMAAALVGAAARRANSIDEAGAIGGVRYVIDTVGGPLQQTVLAALPPGAHLVSLSEPADEDVANRRGVKVAFAVLETTRAQLDGLADLAVRGVLRPRIDHVAQFAEAATIFTRYVSRDVAGKIVIEGAGR